MQFTRRKRPMDRVPSVAVIVFFFFFFPLILCAQSTNALLTGRVNDPTKAVFNSEQPDAGGTTYVFSEGS